MAIKLNPEWVVSNSSKGFNISHNKYSIVLIYSNGCSHCTTFRPVFNSVKKHFKHIPFYELEKTDNDIVKHAVKALRSQCGPKYERGVPLTLIFKYNKLLNCELGSMSEDELIKLINTSLHA